MKHALPPVAQLFAFARTQLNIPQDAMACVLKTSKATLCRIEHGASTPKPEQYTQLALVTGHTPAQLVQAMYNRTFEKQPPLSYTSGLPTIEHATLDALEAARVFVESDAAKLQRKLARYEQQLKGRQQAEEVRAAARPQAEKRLQVQLRTLELLQQNLADEEVLALQRQQVDDARAELALIPDAHAIKQGKLLYESVKLANMKAELNSLQADLAHIVARIKALKAPAIAEQASPQRGPEAAVITAEGEAAPAAHQSQAGRKNGQPLGPVPAMQKAEKPRPRGQVATPKRGPGPEAQVPESAVEPAKIANIGNAPPTEQLRKRAS